MQPTDSGRLRRLGLATVVAVALLSAVPIAVYAAHSFTDVPDTNEFHGSITWMKDNGVTVGCNPPANTQFCPADNVTREEMASFMRRYAQTIGSVGAGVTDPADTVVTTGLTYVELSTITATPKSEAAVVLNGHVTLSKPTATEGSYQVIIAKDSCTGTVLGAASWTAALNAAGTTEASTLAVTATDVATGDSIYVLCAAETVDTSPDATAGLRGLTASWEPTA
jgi:hypothetical protein